MNSVDAVVPSWIGREWSTSTSVLINNAGVPTIAFFDPWSPATIEQLREGLTVGRSPEQY